MIHNEALSFSKDDKSVRTGIGMMNAQMDKEHDTTNNIEISGMDTVAQDKEDIVQQQQREDSVEGISELTEENGEVQNEMTPSGNYPKDLNPFRDMTSDELMEICERLRCEKNGPNTDPERDIGDNNLQLDTPSAYCMAPRTCDKENINRSRRKPTTEGRKQRGLTNRGAIHDRATGDTGGNGPIDS